jgi:hypothetical protein
MSFREDVFGSFVEIINMVIIMNLFSQEYLKHKVRLIICIFIMSVIIGVIDMMNYNVHACQDTNLEILSYELLS